MNHTTLCCSSQSRCFCGQSSTLGRENVPADFHSVGGNTRNLYILWVSCYRDRRPVPKETLFLLGLHPHNYRVRRLHWSRVPTTITLPFFVANSKESRTHSASSWLIVLIPSTADFRLVLCSENGLPTDVLNATNGNQMVLLSEFKSFHFCLSLVSVIPSYSSSSSSVSLATCFHPPSYQVGQVLPRVCVFPQRSTILV